MVFVTVVTVGVWLYGIIGQAQTKPGESTRTFTLWLTEDFTFVGAIGLVVWGSFHSGDAFFWPKLTGCCCIWGVLTPVVLFILVYLLPDIQTEDTKCKYKQSAVSCDF